MKVTIVLGAFGGDEGDRLSGGFRLSVDPATYHSCDICFWFSSRRQGKRAAIDSVTESEQPGVLSRCHRPHAEKKIPPTHHLWLERILGVRRYSLYGSLQQPPAPKGKGSGKGSHCAAARQGREPSVKEAKRRTYILYCPCTKITSAWWRPNGDSTSETTTAGHTRQPRSDLVIQSAPGPGNHATAVRRSQKRRDAFSYQLQTWFGSYAHFNLLLQGFPGPSLLWLF